MENYLCLALNTFIKYSLTFLSWGRFDNLPYLLSFLHLYVSVHYLDICFPSTVLNFLSSLHIEAFTLSHPFWKKWAEFMKSNSDTFLHVSFPSRLPRVRMLLDTECLILNTYILHLHNLHLLIFLTIFFFNWLVIRIYILQPVPLLYFRSDYAN